jgi:hypothetical protein
LLLLAVAASAATADALTINTVDAERGNSTAAPDPNGTTNATNGTSEYRAFDRYFVIKADDFNATKLGSQIASFLRLPWGQPCTVMIFGETPSRYGRTTATFAFSQWSAAERRQVGLCHRGLLNIQRMYGASVAWASNLARTTGMTNVTLTAPYYTGPPEPVLFPDYFWVEALNFNRSLFEMAVARLANAGRPVAAVRTCSIRPIEWFVATPDSPTNWTSRTSMYFTFNGTTSVDKKVCYAALHTAATEPTANRSFSRLAHVIADMSQNDTTVRSREMRLLALRAATWASPTTNVFTSVTTGFNVHDIEHAFHKYFGLEEAPWIHIANLKWVGRSLTGIVRADFAFAGGLLNRQEEYAAKLAHATRDTASQAALFAGLRRIAGVQMYMLRYDDGPTSQYWDNIGGHGDGGQGFNGPSATGGLSLTQTVTIAAGVAGGAALLAAAVYVVRSFVSRRHVRRLRSDMLAAGQNVEVRTPDRVTVANRGVSVNEGYDADYILLRAADAA